jgi:type IV pilus assembly protein PilA
VRKMPMRLVVLCRLWVTNTELKFSKGEHREQRVTAALSFLHGVIATQNSAPSYQKSLIDRTMASSGPPCALSIETIKPPEKANMNRRSGFSLIELLVVVGIILVIVAIAIPNILRARMASNESSAAASIRAIVVAETAYTTAYPAIGYATKIQDLGGAQPCAASPGTACLIDNILAQSVPGSVGHGGYQFLATGLNSGTALNGAFVAGGTPLAPGSSGSKDFCSVNDGVLRAQPTTGGPPLVTAAPCAAYPAAQ